MACGGWRARDVDEPPLRPGDAEIKRMFVHPAHRGRGSPVPCWPIWRPPPCAPDACGWCSRPVTRQPAAIGLYVSAGYAPMAPFGTYRDTEAGRYYSRALPGAFAARWRMIRITYDE